MKLEYTVFSFDTFKEEMTKLRDAKHFDYLVTIIGEDFGSEEGLGCIYILENLAKLFQIFLGIPGETNG